MSNRHGEQAKIGALAVERCRKIELDSWNLLEKLTDAASVEDDANTLAALARAILASKKSYFEAQEAVKAAELDCTLYIPIERVRAIQREFVPPLADAVNSLKNNVASSLPPDMRTAFYKAWNAEITNFDNAVEKIDTELERLLNA